MAPPYLLDLPPEIIFMILQSAHNPQDLFAIIRCCKSLNQSFQSTRLSILDRVVRNAFGPANLYDAVMACKATQLCERLDQERERSTIEYREDFIVRYLSRSSTQVTNIRSQELLHSLCKLWRTVQYFVNLYQENAFCYMQEHVPLLRRGYKYPLTTTEEARLQRAFIRYEIFRKVLINGLSIVDVSEGPWYRRRGKILRLLWLGFFSSLSPWEREELVSVQEYLRRFVGSLHKTLIDYIKKRVFILALQEIDRIVEKNENFRKANPDTVTRFMRATCGGFFGYRCGIFAHMHYQVTRGLPFLRWISSLPSDECIFVMNRDRFGNHPDDREAEWDHHYSDLRKTLFDALTYVSPEVSTEEIPTEQLREVDFFGLNSPNEGWKWVDRNGLARSLTNLYQRVTLRKVGYVFWDCQRITEYWRLHDTTPDKICLRERKADDSYDYGSDELPDPDSYFTDWAFPDTMFKDTRFLKFLHPNSAMKDLDRWPRPFSEAEKEEFGFEY